MTEDKVSFKDKFFFGLNGFPDQMTYQIFQSLIFTYYFVVIQIPTAQMWVAYMLWGIWNAFNDPILGSLSDRKRFGKLGKRKFFIIISFIPLCLMMILLFTVPSEGEFIYFVFIIMLFEFVYTLFDVNIKSIFPEMWNDNQRQGVLIVLRIITILAILIAFIMPGFIIPGIVPENKGDYQILQSGYILTGVIVAIIVFVFGLLFILFGIKEKEESQQKFDQRPPFFTSLKMSFKNKTFVKLIFANMCTWYVLTILPAIYPLYCAYVLGRNEFLYYGLSLAIAFIVAALVMPVHMKIGRKFGLRKGFMINMIVSILSLFPYLLYTNNNVSQILAVINTAWIGFSIAGILYYFDLLMSDIIDQDELRTGNKRSASFYGTNAFIHRMSIIFFITSVSIVFSFTAWSQKYTPTGNVDVIIGLKLLLFVFPAIACGIAFLLMRSYDLHGEKLERMRTVYRKKFATEN